MDYRYQDCKAQFVPARIECGCEKKEVHACECEEKRPAPQCCCKCKCHEEVKKEPCRCEEKKPEPKCKCECFCKCEEVRPEPKKPENLFFEGCVKVKTACGCEKDAFICGEIKFCDEK